MKTFQHPVSKETRIAANDDDVKIAALKKLGYVEIKAADIENDPKLTVVYEQVTRPDVPKEPPALPRLTKPVPAPVPAPPAPPPAPPAQATPGAITREDVQPFVPAKGKDGK